MKSITPQFHGWELATGVALGAAIIRATPWTANGVLLVATALAIVLAIKASQWPAAIAVAFGISLFHLANPVLPSSLAQPVESIAEGVTQ